MWLQSINRIQVITWHLSFYWWILVTWSFAVLHSNSDLSKQPEEHGTRNWLHEYKPQTWALYSTTDECGNTWGASDCSLMNVWGVLQYMCKSNLHIMGELHVTAVVDIVCYTSDVIESHSVRVSSNSLYPSTTHTRTHTHTHTHTCTHSRAHTHIHTPSHLPACVYRKL